MIEEHLQSQLDGKTKNQQHKLVDFGETDHLRVTFSINDVMGESTTAPAQTQSIQMSKFLYIFKST